MHLSADSTEALRDLANGIATDIGPQGIGLITSEPIVPTSLVVIMLRSRYFTHELRAMVVWCRKLPSCGNIIKAQPALGWRMGLLFRPSSDDEKKLLRHIFEQL